MYSNAGWFIAVTVGLAALILTAASRTVGAHTALSAVICLSFALLAVMENRHLYREGASKHAIAAATARYMGIVWSWAALGLLVTYLPAFDILRWKEWMTFTIVAAVIAVLCLMLAATIARDEEKRMDDPTILKLAHYLSVGQLVGMVAAVAGLIFDGKWPVTVKQSLEWQDWAANNIFFFGALAIATITINALVTARQREAATAGRAS